MHEFNPDKEFKQFKKQRYPAVISNWIPHFQTFKCLKSAIESGCITQLTIIGPVENSLQVD